MGDKLLQLEKISKSFGGLRAAHQVDLDVKEGTISALIGPNGAGKTTLFNIIAGCAHLDYPVSLSIRSFIKQALKSAYCPSRIASRIRSMRRR